MIGSKIEPVQVAVAGAGGRMGQTLIEGVLACDDLRLVAAFEMAGSPLVGRDAAERFGKAAGVTVTSDLSAIRGADVLIDFTQPAATLTHVAACVGAGVAVVVGTTGLADSDKRTLAEAARVIPVVFAPNMSVGVNVLLSLVAMAAEKLGPDYDVEIVEMHHRHKVDAPSGTALKLGEAVAAATGRNLADAAVYAREGLTGARKSGSIGFATLRGGDVIGDHTVVFAGAGERIELTHKAASRQTFAQGALRAARFAAARRRDGERGLFDMQDVLRLR